MGIFAMIRRAARKYELVYGRGAAIGDTLAFAGLLPVLALAVVLFAAASGRG